MKFNLSDLKSELNHTLNFWQENILSQTENDLIPEMSILNEANIEAPMGAMFLSRVIYGASAACKTLQDNQYKTLADISLNILSQKFKNPKGGYFWSVNSEGTTDHNIDNNNMAQAFILYGLVEYAAVFESEEIDSIIKEHFNFIESVIKDKNNGGFIDGFDQNWKKLEKQEKSLGTHLHMLEAYTKLRNYMPELISETEIANLISIILEKFTEPNSFDCLHQLSTSCEPLENFVWAGHNAECSWILCKSAQSINNKKLIQECNNRALIQMKNVIDIAIDNENGGVFNVIENGDAIKDEKVWWPQAETVIGLFNCYQITGDIKYINKARQLMDYISNVFIDKNKGEWYSSVTAEGTPKPEIPKIHFWKSLYHNARYYVEVIERINVMKLHL